MPETVFLSDNRIRSIKVRVALQILLIMAIFSVAWYIQEGGIFG